MFSEYSSLILKHANLPENEQNFDAVFYKIVLGMLQKKKNMCSDK